MSGERASRIKHARALLDGLDGRHCGDFPQELFERARGSSLGRRHLVRAAATRFPTLFQPDHERWQAAYDQHPWLMWSHPELIAFTDELGALALAPAMRLALERSQVLFLREALGQDLWRVVQTAEATAAAETLRMMGNVVVQRCGRDAAALRHAVRERGKIEFMAHGERHDRMLAERLAATYDTPPAQPCLRDSWLPDELVGARLAQRKSLDEVGEAEQRIADETGAAI